MKEMKVTQFKDGFEEVDFKIAEEAILHVELNEISFDAVMSPNEIKEFIYGNLFSEGFIKDPKEVTGYSEKVKDDMIHVSLKLDKLDKALLGRNYNIIWTECGSIPEIQKRKGEVLKKINLDFQLKANEVAEFQFKARERINEFSIKGGVHYSGLLDKTLGIMHFTFDIGRHNAVDKVIGMNMMKGEKFEDKILFTTGRVSSDIVVKCLRTRIPIIISSSGPLSSAVKLARDYNLCLIGYLRGRHFTIFSEKEVIVD